VLLLVGSVGWLVLLVGVLCSVACCVGVALVVGGWFVGCCTCDSCWLCCCLFFVFWLLVGSVGWSCLLVCCWKLVGWLSCLFCCSWLLAPGGLLPLLVVVVWLGCCMTPLGCSWLLLIFAGCGWLVVWLVVAIVGCVALVVGWSCLLVCCWKLVGWLRVELFVLVLVVVLVGVGFVLLGWLGCCWLSGWFQHLC
jgi:hypothetical protein